MDENNDEPGNRPVVPTMQVGLANEELSTALLIVYEKYVALLAKDEDTDEEIRRVVFLFNALQQERWHRDNVGDTDNLAVVAGDMLLIPPPLAPDRG